MSSTCRTRSSSTRADGCSSAIDRTSGSRFSIRTATFLAEWTQFGSPSGIFITPDDTLYVVDYNDKMALFIGSAKDGSIRYKIDSTLAEGVVVGPDGSIYVGETVTGKTGDTVTGHTVRKLVRN